MYTEQDIDLLKLKGVSKEQIESQLENFKKGFPFLEIVSAARVGNGILKVDDNEEKSYLNKWDEFLQSHKTVTKFVPASGAASRMFKDLFSFYYSNENIPTTDFVKTFFGRIHEFAFFPPLDNLCTELYGKSIDQLCDEDRYKDVLKVLLSDEGKNYANKPKGLLLFHSYPEGNRTPLGEHLTEGVFYAKNADNVVNIHFTVSEEHKEMFELLTAARRLNYELKLDSKFLVSFSVQKPSTDTIAVDLNNEPFREEDGTLLFRPGGHGALIENLNDINSDVIFIKNIDNVVPDRLKENEAHYKKLLAGVLVTMQERAHDYLEKLDSGDFNSEYLNEMLSFTKNELNIHNSAEFTSEDDLKKYLKEKLDRPFRVCGMVKNEGEPGGGPFIVKNIDGTASLQILESSQINKDDKSSMDLFNNGSHFNPVDVVCGVKCYQNNKFDLTKYVDANTGFISLKSKDGKELKALELPGLWNGAMSNWNTIFVEVPVSTFNPVKTVNDLLRPEHQ
jgi:hypothetical protein